MPGKHTCERGLLSAQGGGVDAQQPAVSGYFVTHAQGDDVTRNQLLNWIVVNFYSITQHTAQHIMFGGPMLQVRQGSCALLSTVPSNSTNI
jgi:hypothetical protein